MFGLVDYEDEEDDIPMNLGNNGKDGGEVLPQPSEAITEKVRLRWQPLFTTKPCVARMAGVPQLSVAVQSAATPASVGKFGGL